MAVDEWLDGQADRCFDRQRAQTDNAKIVATFVTATAAGLVATGLQVGDTASDLDRSALMWLGFATVAGVAVALLDRIHEANHSLITMQAHLGGWSDAQLLRTLRDQTLKVVVWNERSVRDVKIALAVNVSLSVFAAYEASRSLLG